MSITPDQLAGDSEHSQQVALFAQAALEIKNYPQLCWMFAVPNGFFASPGQKAKMKAEGLKSGVPDVWLPIPSYGYNLAQERYYIAYCGLVIEMKVGKNKTSEEQGEWLAYLSKAGYKCHICYGWKEAWQRIMEYLNA